MGLMQSNMEHLNMALNMAQVFSTVPTQGWKRENNSQSYKTGIHHLTMFSESVQQVRVKNTRAMGVMQKNFETNFTGASLFNLCQY